MRRILFVGIFLLVGCGQQTEGTKVEIRTDQETFEWKMVTSWIKNAPGLGTAPERFVEMVDIMSNGRLRISVYGAGEFVGGFEVFDAVSSGSAEMGHSASYYWTGKMPVATLFSTVPFGMTAQEMNSWLAHGGGLELWRELYEPFNLYPMPGGNSGVQMAGWFRKEINSVADIEGLRMRIPGLGGEVFERAGGVPVVMPGGEIFTSLQTGAIDATEWVVPFIDLAYGFYDVASYYYYPGWHEPGTTLEFTVNLDAWNSLPADLQKIVEVASRAINQDMLDELTARNGLALKTLIEDHGIKVVPLPDDVLARMHELSEGVFDDVAGEDPLAQRIVQSYREFAEVVKEYNRVAEAAYLQARDR